MKRQRIDNQRSIILYSLAEIARSEANRGAREEAKWAEEAAEMAMKSVKKYRGSSWLY